MLRPVLKQRQYGPDHVIQMTKYEWNNMFTSGTRTALMWKKSRRKTGLVRFQGGIIYIISVKQFASC